MILILKVILEVILIEKVILKMIQKVILILVLILKVILILKAIQKVILILKMIREVIRKVTRKMSEFTSIPVVRLGIKHLRPVLPDLPFLWSWQGAGVTVH